jgi:molecular chaperone GrpE
MPEDLKRKDSEAKTDGEAADSGALPEDAKAESSELDSLKQELVAKESEAKSNYDRFLRQVAEFENLKRRSAREREDLSRFANEALIKDLLPIVDNLERAVAHASGGGNGKPIVEGVEMVLKALLDVLARHGVAQISAIGQIFDPCKHEAIAQVESDTHEPNAVVEELHKGYSLHDRLLRPSLVSVAKTAESHEKKNAGNQVENDPTDD